MYFPVANIDINPIIPPIVAFCISFFTSMGGMSGAFLILPFQISILGFASPSVSATNQLFNVFAIPGGVYRYIKEKRMVWPLALVVMAGTIPGVILGALLRINYLPDPKKFKLFAGFVLLYIGIKLIKDLIIKNKKNKDQIIAEKEFLKQTKNKNSTINISVKKDTIFNFTYEFLNKKFKINTIILFIISLIVGVIGGVYGIGGGAIIAPLFVSFFGLPVYIIAGAALLGTLATSLIAVGFYEAISPFYSQLVVRPDWALGLLFGIGGFCGMYCGARLQKFIPAKLIKLMLVFCVLFPAVKYIIDFLK